MQFFRSIVFLSLLCSCLTACEPKARTVAGEQAEFPGITGRLEHAALAEASGVAVSQRNPDVIWLINDNGNDAVLFAAARDGAHLAALPVRGATNVDWEDLASFELDGDAWLLIGDIGDNDSVHADRVLYAVREPDLTMDPPHAQVAWSIRYVYPDGPRDAEAMAVDIQNKKVLVLSKRSLPAELYTLPLRPVSGAKTSTAELVATLNTLPSPTEADLAESRRMDPDVFVWHWQPTAMDISADGRKVAILTYRDAYVYPRTSRDSWQDVFADEPRALGQRIVAEAEALCFLDDHHLLITAEGEHAAIQTLSITADR